jgi:hypothetical protein
MPVRPVTFLSVIYKACRRKIEMTPGAQSRDDTPVGGGHDERGLNCIAAVKVEQRI